GSSTLVQQFRKIRVPAAAHYCGWHRTVQDGSLYATETLIVAKDKDLILDDRTTGRYAELVLAKSTLGDSAGIFKIVGGVELVVAEESPCGTVQLVGTRLKRGVQNRRAGTAVFRAETRGLDFELLDRVNRRQNDEVSAVQKVHCI